MRRKMRDRSMALVVVGALFLLPPVGAISRLDLGLDGLTVSLTYVFSLWLALIIGAAALSRHLRDDHDTPQSPPKT